MTLHATILRRPLGLTLLPGDLGQFTPFVSRKVPKKSLLPWLVFFVPDPSQDAGGFVGCRLTLPLREFALPIQACSSTGGLLLVPGPPLRHRLRRVFYQKYGSGNQRELVLQSFHRHRREKRFRGSSLAARDRIRRCRWALPDFDIDPAQSVRCGPRGIFGDSRSARVPASGSPSTCVPRPK